MTSSVKQTIDIDLPTDIISKLEVTASAHGLSIKTYLENIIIRKAQSPGPSEDSWFDEPENIDIVKHGIEDAKKGNTREYTMSEINSLLGL